MMADVARRIGIETKISVQQEKVRVVIELVTAEPALQTQRAEDRFVGAKVQCGHVACDFGDPIAKVLRAARDGGMCILIATIDR